MYSPISLIMKWESYPLKLWNITGIFMSSKLKSKLHFTWATPLNFPVRWSWSITFVCVSLSGFLFVFFFVFSVCISSSFCSSSSTISIFSVNFCLQIWHIFASFFKVVCCSSLRLWGLFVLWIMFPISSEISDNLWMKSEIKFSSKEFATFSK